LPLVDPDVSRETHERIESIFRQTRSTGVRPMIRDAIKKALDKHGEM
jgi:hypothetical protein